MLYRKSVCSSVLLLGALMVVRLAAGSLSLGANFNEHLTVARVPALDLTGVQWIRGFLPAGEFLDVPRPVPLGAGERRQLATDPGVAAFRAAAASGRKVAVTLKWDFKRTHWRVPVPDSADEQKAFAWALEVVQVMHPDLLLLVNELFIDTEEADLAPGPDGVVPMVRFLQRLAAHVAASRLKAPDGSPMMVSCGGFTRLDLPATRKQAATKALLPWLATTPNLTHVNFHLHQQSLAQFEQAVKFMHAQMPQRPFVVTEFSLVWAFKQGMREKLGATAVGRRFAEQFHCPPGQTVAAYLSAAAKTPVSEAELHAFLASRPWFDPQGLEKMCGFMEQNGVVLATFAYLQASSGLERPQAPVGEAQPPWRLNPVFQERHAFVPNSDRLAVNLEYFDTFVHRQR